MTTHAFTPGLPDPMERCPRCNASISDVIFNHKQCVPESRDATQIGLVCLHCEVKPTAPGSEWCGPCEAELT